MPRRCVPCTTRGANESPPLPLMSAPINLSGSISLPIGRLRRDASPVMIERKGWLARRPPSRRIVVALFPALSTPAASLRPCRPVPEISRSGDSGDPRVPILTPSALRQRTVERQSFPGAEFRILASPSARLLRIMARWVMDLSPGRIMSPCNLVQGLTVLDSPSTEGRTLLLIELPSSVGCC